MKDLSRTALVAAAAKLTASDGAKAIHKESPESKPAVLTVASGHMLPSDAAAVGVIDVSAAAVGTIGATLVAAGESAPTNEALAADGKLPVAPPLLPLTTCQPSPTCQWPSRR